VAFAPKGFKSFRDKNKLLACPPGLDKAISYCIEVG